MANFLNLNIIPESIAYEKHVMQINSNTKPMRRNGIVPWKFTCTELERRQSLGQIAKDVLLLTVEDPRSNVGSGGATINALLTVTEHLSANCGYSVINPDVLKDSKILICHSGRSYPYDPCGRAFLTLPSSVVNPDYDGLICNLDILIRNISEKLAVKSGAGIWVCSTDMILSIPKSADIPWIECEAAAITVPATAKYCKNHGVYKIDKEGYVEDILYQKDIGSLECCERESDGKVPVVCSVIYLSTKVAERLLLFYIKPPLDACTYMGIDSGEPPIQLSLFFDVVLPMATGVKEEDFIDGKLSRQIKLSGDPEETKIRRIARTLLWKELHKFKLWACMLETGDFHYLASELNEHKKALISSPLQSNFSKSVFSWSNQTHSYMSSSCKVGEECVSINSVIQGNVNLAPKSVTCHCSLNGSIEVGRETYVGGITLEHMKRKTLKIAENMVVQGFHIHIKTLNKSVQVLTTHGKFDKIEAPMWKSSSTFCNMTWVIMLNATGILKEDLWGTDVADDDQNILNAKLFPVFHATDPIGMHEILWLQGQTEERENAGILHRWRSSWRLSLKEILSFVNIEEEFQRKRELFYEVKKHEICTALKQRENRGFRAIYNSARIDGFSSALLNTLDAVARDEGKSDPGVAARTLANIADVLGCWAGIKGGLRSGPAANKSWAKAFQLLEIGELERGVEAMTKERANWIHRSDLLIRAARHYEGAAQILIRQAVMTAKTFFKAKKHNMPFINKWVTATCPARIDVSGGWSDTPPITYEHGGAVTTVALQVNGQKPVGAKAKRIDEPKIVLVICGNNVDNTTVECKELSDLEDYYNPHSPGALLKAAFVCAEIVNLQSDIPLRKQLMDNYGSGFEVHSWSNLPHGSGMGTSSILAGAVMAALLRASGKECDTNGLIHAVSTCTCILDMGTGSILAGAVMAALLRASGKECDTNRLIHAVSTCILDMGISSILAGAVMAALLRASGKECDTNGLIHAVLYLEQLLTTGGGWQDQVGGLTGGIKIGLSESKLPISVEAVDLKVSEKTIQALNERLVLIYTGKTRLAKNLLQEVLRNWYARNPQIVETEDALVVLAQECAHAFIDGDLKKVGKCLDRYWIMKKIMAPGCETESIANLMTAARPFSYGMCMAGAGGGGFLYVLTKDKDHKKLLLDILPTIESSEGHSVYEACVDTEGLEIDVEEY
ncbi:hypothetical protein FSP39_015281 [Pinctada imbricata]|uniref:L-fucose kinase n=1 Tax=Pinctada imbricata TaxID=66713 RepID=A0AA88XIY9_PINIB|nr:hypothetical protein FSP39_015281 [Pinctada imbricata]